MRGPSFYGGKRARNRTGVPLVRDLLTARGFEPESNCHVDTIQKQRGLALATSGLAVAIGVIALLNALRFAQVTPREWVVTALACCVTVGGLWLLLRSGERLWRGWDPHFVLVPTLAVTLLLSELAWAAAEARLMVLVVWPVVLLFLAGYVGFGTGALMSALMTAGYLAAVVLAEPPGTRIGVELVLALVFLVTSLFGCVVLGRIRHQRLALAAARADLARLVNTDPLTELPNRRQFATVFGAEVARVERYGGSFSLGVLDCDNFKSYTATPPATRRWWSWRGCCASSCGPATRWRGWAGRSSLCCWWAWTRRPPPAWRSASAAASRVTASVPVGTRSR
jgi:hypothetical protein